MMNNIEKLLLQYIIKFPRLRRLSLRLIRETSALRLFFSKTRVDSEDSDSAELV